MASKKSKDSGWAWVVLIIGILCSLQIGLMYCAGIFNVFFLDVFNEGKAKTAWVGGLFTSLVFVAGPLASFVVNLTSVGTSLILGGVLCFLGYFLSWWATSLEYLIVSLGLVGGIGYSLIFTPVQIVVAQYFDRYQMLAFGLLTVSVSIGTIVFPLFLTFTIQSVGWRGCFWLLAGIALHNCAFGLLLRASGNKSETSKDNHIEAEKGSIEKKPIKFEDNQAPPVSFHWSIFKNLNFLIIFVSLLLHNGGFTIVYMHLPASLFHKGMTPEMTSYLMSIAGIASIIGKLALIFLTSMTKANMIALYGVTVFLTGLFTFTFVFIGPGFLVNAFACALWGLMPVAYNCVMSPMAILLIKQDYLPSAIGAFSCACGLGFVVGPLAAGWLYDVTGVYDCSFYLAGSLSVGAALILCLIPFVSKPARKQIHYQYEEVKVISAS